LTPVRSLERCPNTGRASGRRGRLLLPKAFRGKAFWSAARVSRRVDGLARVVLFPGTVDRGTCRLLVVDDEAAIRFALTEYFRESGWMVDAAAEKEEAEALLACTQYEVVIADLRLTGIYGVEGLDIIQCSRHLRPETRVVLLTGNGTPEIEAEARRRGADAFLAKPLPLPQLEAVVDSLLEVAS